MKLGGSFWITYVLSHVWLFETLWTVAYQALLSMGFSRQENWNMLPFPPPQDLPNPGFKPASLALAGRLYHWATGKAPYFGLNCSFLIQHLEKLINLQNPAFFQFQFSRSVMSDSATPWTAACQACLSITNSRSPPNLCPLCQGCHPIISSSVVPFSSYHQSFPASGSFQMSQLSASGGQSIGVSASTLVLPMNTQIWSPLGWTAWISLQSKGLSRVFSNTTVQKHQFFSTQLSL